jgi:hypothetical protein
MLTTAQLIHSGRMLKERHAGGGVGRVEFNFKRTMPTAMDRFQNELDELDNDIFQAQVVLRRDLALLQADRQKREQAEAAERQRMLAAESSAKNKPPAKPDPPNPIVVTAPKPVVVAAPKVSPPLPTPQATNTTSKPTQPIAPSELEREKEEQPKPIPTASVPLPAAPPPVDDTPTATAQDSEFDFEAMFGDSLDDIKGDGDANNQEDMAMDTSGPDLNFTIDDSGPSLLRGLEDFAKSSDDEVAAAGQSNTDPDLDFSMPDVPDVPTIQPVEPPSAAKPVEPTTSQQFTDNTNFDTMATDDLDDLFNMGYENPEATQFDDAFFGFDET